MIKYSKIFQILHLEQNFYFFNSAQLTNHIKYDIIRATKIIKLQRDKRNG